ncbi:DUF5808 domain-containing protein [Gorillibacterium sp. sgz500922]|uniref:DUF5808 domain-containing protein n=1 Tax=Gorillibacterium sp. sgz500922 TaxID=3446694 RepID=UPI003F670A71
MISYYLLAAALGIGAIFTGVWSYQAKLRRGRLLGVTLPVGAAEDAGVQGVRAEYRRSSRRAALFLLAALVPFFFSRGYFAVNYAYFFIWLILAYFVSSRPFVLANRALKRIKRERGWSAGASRTVQADLRLSRDKDKGALPVVWFLLPLVPSAVLLIRSVQAGQTPVAVTSAIAILNTLLFLAMALLSARLKARVYHRDSLLNLELQRRKLRAQSLLWLLLAGFEALFAFLFALSLNGERESSGILPVWAVLTVAVPVLLLILFLRYWESIKNRLLPEEGGEGTIVRDEDDDWVDGLYYRNPDNPAVFVEDRSGFGTTVNLGTKRGRAVLWGSLGASAVLVLGIGILIGVMDSATPRWELRENGRVQIDYPLYSYGFPLEQVKSVTLVDRLPHGRRTNGLETDRTARGNFRFADWGRSKVYIFRNNPPYLVVELDGMHVVYNKKNPQDTRELYASLRAAWEKGN